ncbi:LysR substrate-binding domain-containing protein [Vibrio sp. MACH09]|uniref:LysR substrate-binding domain-containing protein n=1 Tax=Vibrio sp. MACH09 TaxID=3025122 RepID=UPI00295E6169|nr:LysR substrate-binding domain-containing protein [Vibrio sp. MACH09]
MLNISLKQLNVFFSITQHGSLTCAANALCLSKSAVSMALSELEKQLGTALFDRVNNRLILNHEGRTLLPLADELIARANEISTLFTEGSSSLSSLRIGASETIGNQVAPYLLGDLAKQAPDKLHRLFISNSAAICEKLLDYELDAGLIEGTTTHPELISQVFSGDEMAIIAASSSPLADGKKVSISQLNNQPWVLREPGSGTREFFLHSIAPNLTDWHESVELNTTEAIINSVSVGLGFACLSQLAVGSAIADGRVKAIQLDVEMKRQFYLVYHKQKYLNPQLSRLISHCLPQVTV